MCPLFALAHDTDNDTQHSQQQNVPLYSDKQIQGIFKNFQGTNLQFSSTIEITKKLHLYKHICISTA